MICYACWSDNHLALHFLIRSPLFPSSLPQQQQRRETAKDDQSIIDAETRQNTTWLPPPVVPVANKPGGTAVGFMGKTAAGERWLLKLGMDKTEGHKATASILSKSVAVRGVSTDAIQEVVATKAFKVLPRMPSAGMYTFAND